MREVTGLEAVLVGAIRRAVGKVPGDFTVTVEIPENPAHGEYATSAAMQLASIRQQAPLEIAKALGERLHRDKDLGEIVERIEAVPPGFVNFFLSPQWLQAQVSTIAAAGADYGRRELPKRERQKIQVEFISANPTGPLTLANGRGGFLGDTLANVLTAVGHEVTREYYVNDTGEQVRKLGWSVLAAEGYATPYSKEELYQGSYVAEMAKKLDIAKPKSESPEPNTKLAESVAREASKTLLKDIKRFVTRKAKIRMDVWFSEKSLTRQGLVDETLKTLKRKRLVEERDGALWLKLSELKGSRSEDKVVVKSSGEPTYVLPDLAYHTEKFQRRNFDRVVDIFGADHQGHVKVLSAGLSALGLPTPDFIVTQMIRLVEDGKEVKMSKRAGTFVTLEELLDEVGVDVARWFFLERSPSTHMDFDLALAKEQSEKNPVFYVQYAHARCSAILRKAEEQGRLSVAKSAAPASPKQSAGRAGGQQKPLHPSERVLMAQLVRLPDLVARIASSYEVHHLPTYATDVAKAFSAFYRDCPVLSDDPALTASRLDLVRATKAVVASTLGLMGIRAPERM